MATFSLKSMNHQTHNSLYKKSPGEPMGIFSYIASNQELYSKDWPSIDTALDNTSPIIHDV